MSVKFKWETEFKETEIGEIPRDWEVRNLTHAEMVYGGNLCSLPAALRSASVLTPLATLKSCQGGLHTPER